MLKSLLRLLGLQRDSRFDSTSTAVVVVDGQSLHFLSQVLDELYCDAPVRVLAPTEPAALDALNQLAARFDIAFSQ